MVDPLIPGETCLCREPGHRLNQWIYLDVEQHLAVTGLQCLYSIVRADFPILHGNLVGRSVNRQAKVIGLADDDKVEA